MSYSCFLDIHRLCLSKFYLFAEKVDLEKILIHPFGCNVNIFPKIYIFSHILCCFFNWTCHLWNQKINTSFYQWLCVLHYIFNLPVDNNGSSNLKLRHESELTLSWTYDSYLISFKCFVDIANHVSACHIFPWSNYHFWENYGGFHY